MNAQKEGTISFWIHNIYDKDWATNDKQYHFTGANVSGWTIEVDKHPDKSLEITTSGPEGLRYHRRVSPIPPCKPDGQAMVVISWKLPQWFLYLNGKAIAEGVREEQQVRVSQVGGPVTALGYLITPIPPYSDKMATVMVGASLADYSKGNRPETSPRVKLGVVQFLLHTPDTKQFTLNLETNPEASAFIDGKKMTVRLLNISKEKVAEFDNSEWPVYDFLVTRE